MHTCDAVTGAYLWREKCIFLPGTDSHVKGNVCVNNFPVPWARSVRASNQRAWGKFLRAWVGGWLSNRKTHGCFLFPVRWNPPHPSFPPCTKGRKIVAVCVCELAFVGKSRRMEISRPAFSARRERTLLGSVANVVSRRWRDPYTYCRIELCLMFTPFGSRNAGAQIKSVVTFRCLACWFLSEGWEGTNFRMRLVPVC